MMKFMCIFVCAIAAVSANEYGRQGYEHSKLGGYAYQVQPALTVKAIVPAGGYGGGYGNNNRGYGGNSYGRSIEVPVSAVYTSNQGYGHGYGAPAVDRQAIGLAKLSLAAPNAGKPLVWNEPRQVIEESYGHRQSYAPQQSYAEKAQGASAAAASAAVAGKKNEGYGYKSSGY
ncbi:chorion protein S18 [Drosophila sulfurigaster albostrigata]|uniref:Chorion protein S18 n=1 Tax=Drosophila albomicans TaxID=7291 RepID=A0A6P8WJ03_DROAB|nr:chorion protein S18 [Drosophila albomicans]XP_062135492.1 chorion protein S18 [Drosophila sulfurigaster albostrigata]